MWKKFSNEKPEDLIVLFYDVSNHDIALISYTDGSGYGIGRSVGYYCNQPDCNWIFDDCCCRLIIDGDDWWMKIPFFPVI